MEEGAIAIEIFKAKKEKKREGPSVGKKIRR